MPAISRDPNQISVWLVFHLMCPLPIRLCLQSGVQYLSSGDTRLLISSVCGSYRCQLIEQYFDLYLWCLTRQYTSHKGCLLPRPNYKQQQDDSLKLIPLIGIASFWSIYFAPLTTIFEARKPFSGGQDFTFLMNDLPSLPFAWPTKRHTSLCRDLLTGVATHTSFLLSWISP